MKNDFVPSVAPHSGCVCGGCGEVWKYFKDDRVKVVDQAGHYCPVCHPNLAQPILPKPGQVEITHEEFERLRITEGWTIA